MARGRMLSTDVSSDPDAQSLSIASYALYLSTIPHLDRDGLIDAHPLKLVAIAAPMRYEFRDQAAALINEWVEIGLVIRYQVSSRQSVLFFKGFRRHQQGMEYKRESASRFPPPPGWTRTEEGLVPDDPELCFRIAEYFHVKSDYRRILLTVAAGDVPEEIPKPSRSVREPSRSNREEFAPNRTETEQKLTNGGGDVSTYTPTSHHVGNSERGYAKLAALLAETPDDDLRIGIDAIAAKYLLEESFTGWTRALAGWSREDLLLVLAMLKTWDYQTDEQIQRMYNPPGVIKAALKAEYRSWPILAADALADLAADIEDAVELAPLPTLEAREQFSDRRFSRGLAMKYGEMTRERA